MGETFTIASNIAMAVGNSLYVLHNRIANFLRLLKHTGIFLCQLFHNWSKGPPWQSGLSKLALTDRNMKVRFRLKVSVYS
jgi:hypothetical protein